MEVDKNKLIIFISIGVGLIILGALVFIQGTQILGQGTISGKVTIGPLCPVEPCQNPDPIIYTSRQLILKPYIGNPIYIQLNPDGSFKATVNAGTYSVSVTNCTFVGCERSLPQTVIVSPNKTTIIDINIDTGIR